MTDFLKLELDRFWVLCSDSVRDLVSNPECLLFRSTLQVSGRESLQGLVERKLLLLT
jgi:hypothetical protein